MSGQGSNAMEHYTHGLVCVAHPYAAAAQVLRSCGVVAMPSMPRCGVICLDGGRTTRLRARRGGFWTIWLAQDTAAGRPTGMSQTGRFFSISGNTPPRSHPRALLHSR